MTGQVSEICISDSVVLAVGSQRVPMSSSSLFGADSKLIVVSSSKTAPNANFGNTEQQAFDLNNIEGSSEAAFVNGTSCAAIGSTTFYIGGDATPFYSRDFVFLLPVEVDFTNNNVVTINKDNVIKVTQTADTGCSRSSGLLDLLVVPSSICGEGDGYCMLASGYWDKGSLFNLQGQNSDEATGFIALFHASSFTASPIVVDAIAVPSRSLGISSTKSVFLTSLAYDGRRQTAYVSGYVRNTQGECSENPSFVLPITLNSGAQSTMTLGTAEVLQTRNGNAAFSTYVFLPEAANATMTVLGNTNAGEVCGQSSILQLDGPYAVTGGASVFNLTAGTVGDWMMTTACVLDAKRVLAVLQRDSGEVALAYHDSTITWPSNFVPTILS